MSSGRAEEEVIVVGGGIAGLAAAIALRQRGVVAVVLEQAPDLREIGAGLLLGPNACAVLERLGALGGLRAGRSVEVSRWELRNWRGRLISSLKIPLENELSLSTRRSDLQWALLQCLPRDTIRLDAAVTGAKLTRDGVRLSLADGREMTAERVILADGAHSACRNSLWPGREPRYAGYVGWRGLVEHVPEGWESGRVSESWGKGGRFGLAPVGNGLTYWYASANVARSRCLERRSVAQLRCDFAGWHAPVAELLEAMPEETLLQHPISDRCPNGPWHLGEKAVLAGDAAHPLTPNLGQGASMALEDAWELAAQWGRPGAMARYERKRKGRMLGLWAASRALGKVIQWRHPALCWLREAQMLATPDALTTAGMRRLLRYQPSGPAAP